MVARIITGKSIRGILKYNEEKVSEGKAELIHSSGFAKETNALSIRDKISRFEMLTKLKPKLKTNALHIYNGPPDHESEGRSLGHQVPATAQLRRADHEKQYLHC